MTGTAFAGAGGRFRRRRKSAPLSGESPRRGHRYRHKGITLASPHKAAHRHLDRSTDIQQRRHRCIGEHTPLVTLTSADRGFRSRPIIQCRYPLNTEQQHQGRRRKAWQPTEPGVGPEPVLHILVRVIGPQRTQLADHRDVRPAGAGRRPGGVFMAGGSR